MMNVFFFLSCVALASARNLKIDEMEYGFCRGSPEPLSIVASVVPFPVVVAEGETVSLFVELTLNEPIPVGAQLSLNIKKEGFISIPFPCTEVAEGVHLGSCDYDIDHLLEIGGDAVCTPLFPEGQDCMLPMNPGVYGGGDPVVITLPEIPAIITQLLVPGTIYADATISLADGTEMACIYFRLKLVK
eukprot:GFUD01020507.1.p1 GENE.GFUD01020507.1~~GFUD01020507.1.p1  ORF type:complete len:196 (+),score=39.46 GFUD01020507.1:25-588(+)